MKIITTVFACFTSLIVIGQVPVHFNYLIKKTDAKHCELHITAKMYEGWHIYSQNQPNEAIAQPTKILFSKNPLITITGKTKERGKKEKYEDKAAGIIQYQYGDSVDFVQALTLKATAKTNIIGTITYQACTDEKCLSPKTEKFEIKIE